MIFRPNSMDSTPPSCACAISWPRYVTLFLWVLGIFGVPLTLRAQTTVNVWLGEEYVRFDASQIANGTAREIPIITEPANYDLRKLSTTHINSFTPAYDVIFRSRIDTKKRVLVIEPAPDHVRLPYDYREEIQVVLRSTGSPIYATLSVLLEETRSTVVTRPLYHYATKRSYVLFPEGLRVVRDEVFPVFTPLLITKGAQSFALDPAGNTLALAYPGRSLLRIFDAETSRELSTVKLPDTVPFTFAFANNRITYRVPLSDGAALTVHPANGSPLLQSIPVPAPGLSWCPPRLDPLADRLWVRARRLAANATAPRSRLYAFPVLADGRLGDPVVNIETEAPGQDHPTVPEPVVFSAAPAFEGAVRGTVLGADRSIYRLDATRQPSLIQTLSDDIIGLDVNGAACITRTAVVHVSSGHLLASNRFQADAFINLDSINLYASFAGDGFIRGFNGFYFSRLPADGLGLFEPGRHFLLPTDNISWPEMAGRQLYNIWLSSRLTSDSVSRTLFSDVVEQPTISLDSPLVVGEKVSWNITHLRSFYNDWSPAYTGTAEVFDIHPGAATHTIRHEPDSRVVEKLVLPLRTLKPGLAWTLRTSVPWPGLSANHGVGSTDVTVTLDFATRPADLNSFQIFIASASGEIAVDVELKKSPLVLSKLLAPDSVDYAFALSDTLLDSGETRTALLQIDPADGRITRKVMLPFKTDLLVYHPKDRQLIVSSQPSEYLNGHIDTTAPAQVPLLAFDPETLVKTKSATASIDLRATYGDWAGLSHEVVPAEAGKIVLQPRQDSGNPAWKIDLASGQALPISVWPGGAGLADPDRNAYYYADLTVSPAVLRKYTLDQTGPTPLATASRPAGDLYDPTILRFSPATGVVEWCGQAYDRDLRPLVAHPDQFLSGGGVEPYAVAARLAYDLSAPDVPRTLGPTPFLVTYQATRDRFIMGRSDGFTSLPWSALEIAPQPAAQIFPLPHGFRLLPYPDPLTDALLETEVRRSSTDDWSKNPHSAYSHYDSGFISNGLPDDTAHEIRFRVHRSGFSTPWSDPIPFITALAAPSFPPDLPYIVQVQSGPTVSVPLQVLGSRIQAELISAPEGMTYDPATRSLIGQNIAPGTHRIEIRFTNPVGQAQRTLILELISPLVEEPSARYAGLLTLDSAPLTGRWNITRTGDRITGTYRTPIFTRSFAARFQPLPPDARPFTNQIAETKITYDGVKITVVATWDRVADRISLSGNTNGLVQDIYFATEPDTGFASHWASKNRPYPKSARYTALMIPEPNSGALAPAGSGLLRLDAGTDGTANIAVTTSLGQTLTQSVAISDAHSVPFFHIGSSLILVGGLELQTSAEQPAPLVGAMVWAKDSDRKSSSYRDGFEQELLVVGAPLPPTGKKLPPLAPLANPENRADLLLSEGGLDRLSKPIGAALAPGPLGFTLAKAGTPENPNRVTLKLDPKTGLVTGSAAIRDELNTKTLRTISFRGQLVKDPFGDGEDAIGGYFLLPDVSGILRSGKLELTEPSAPETNSTPP